jgi:hypothetical protein
MDKIRMFSSNIEIPPSLGMKKKAKENHEMAPEYSEEQWLNEIIENEVEERIVELFHWFGRAYADKMKDVTDPIVYADRVPIKIASIDLYFVRQRWDLDIYLETTEFEPFGLVNYMKQFVANKSSDEGV